MIVTSIDFETANPSDVSICAAGIAVFDDGTLVESKHWLVRPPKGHGWFLDDFIECHGITHLDVWHEPEFPCIAPEITERLTRAELVIAHNAPFDMRKLRATLNHFELPCPSFDFLCTLCAARAVWPDLPGHSLDALADHIGHPFRRRNRRTRVLRADARRKSKQPEGVYPDNRDFDWALFGEGIRTGLERPKAPKKPCYPLLLQPKIKKNRCPPKAVKLPLLQRPLPIKSA